MKKIMMLLMFLIGLGMSAKLKAQQDLEVFNTVSPGCTAFVIVSAYDGNCSLTSSTSFTIPPGRTIIPNPIGTCTAIIVGAVVSFPFPGSTGTVMVDCSTNIPTATLTNCNGATSFLNYTPPAYSTPTSPLPAISNAILTIN